MSVSIPRQAMILAAGLGKRMRPLTDTMPKPMIEVAGRSIIDRALDQLEQVGVETVIINTSYKAEMLEAHLRKRTSPQLIFSREAEPLETGGGIAKALSHFGNKPFFCVNGDIIWFNGAIPALARLADHWQDELDALLLMQPIEKAMGYDGKGDFFMDKQGLLTRRKATEKAPYVYAVLQILHPRLCEGCPQGAFSLNLLYDRAMAANPPRIKGLLHDSAWLHIGDVASKDLAEDYIQSQN